MKCPECKHQIISKAFESYCSKCGLVVEDEPLVVERTETNKEIPTTTAGGIMGYAPKSLKEVFLSDKKTLSFFNFKKDIVRVCDQLHLPNWIKDDALKLLEQVIETNFALGRDFDCVVGSCVFLSAKRGGFEVSLNDLAEFCLVSIKSLENTSTKMNNKFNLGLKVETSMTVRYLNELLNKKIIDKDIFSESLRISKPLEKSNMSERLRTFCIAFFLLRTNKDVSLSEFCEKLKIKKKQFRFALNRIGGEVLLLKWQKINAFT